MKKKKPNRKVSAVDKPMYKTVVVEMLKSRYDVIVDANIFDNIHMEAATRIIEKYKDDRDFKVAAVMQCYDKAEEADLNKHMVYNTYYVFINAGLYVKAEKLRDIVKKTHNIDMKYDAMK